VKDHLDTVRDLTCGQNPASGGGAVDNEGGSRQDGGDEGEHAF
jgi:hypothetical protein